MGGVSGSVLTTRQQSAIATRDPASSAITTSAAFRRRHAPVTGMTRDKTTLRSDPFTTADPRTLAKTDQENSTRETFVLRSKCDPE
jgi:hypothetical protein